MRARNEHGMNTAMNAPAEIAHYSEEDRRGRVRPMPGSGQRGGLDQRPGGGRGEDASRKLPATARCRSRPYGEPGRTVSATAR